MQKYSVLLLQDNQSVNEDLKRLFNSTDSFEVIGCATDGITGVELAEKLLPDFVVLELVLSGIDGLCVMDKIKSINKNIKVIVLSAFSREEIILKAIERGAVYFMVKPFNFEILKERMLECLQTPTNLEKPLRPTIKKELDEKISKIFINVGIPPHIKGYGYLREGVKMAVESPDIINNITKKLYPMIGERYQTTASKVERAIRHAIEVAWNRGRIENINNILGVKAYVGSEKPTNGEFIALVADKMLLDQA